jgi:Na+-transporting NADH:ubiquinone oxidoreductase subunit NqrF
MEIILGVAMFTAIVMVLVLLILFAKSKLVNTGDIAVEVNGDLDKSFTAPAGDKLLNMLSSQGDLRFVRLWRRRFLWAMSGGDQRGRRRYPAD